MEEKGTVKWFNHRRGYGFISGESGVDIFVHFSGIVGEGFKNLREGEIVSFDVASGVHGLHAINVVRAGIEAAAA